MSQVVEVDLLKTGGKLLPPGLDPPTPVAPPKPVDPPAIDPPTPVAPPKPVDPPAAVPAAEPPKPKVDPEDAYAFCQAVWRDEPFRKTEKLFGGAVAVTFRTLTPDQEELIARRVASESFAPPEKGGPAPGEDPRVTMMVVAARGVELRLALSVDRLVVGTKEYAPLADAGAALAAVRAACGSEAVYQPVRSAYGRFAQAVAALQDGATDPSFWPATGSGGPVPGSPPPASRG